MEISSKPHGRYNDGVRVFFKLNQLDYIQEKPMVAVQSSRDLVPASALCFYDPTTRDLVDGVNITSLGSTGMVEEGSTVPLCSPDNHVWGSSVVPVPRAPKVTIVHEQRNEHVLVQCLLHICVQAHVLLLRCAG